MARVTPTVSQNGDSNSVTARWPAVDGGDVCDPVELPNYPDKTLQISGVTVTSVSFQGSNDGVEYFPLTDLDGNALTNLAAEGLKVIRENVKFIKPVPTTGTDMEFVINAAK